MTSCRKDNRFKASAIHFDEYQQYTNDDSMKKLQVKAESRLSDILIGESLDNLSEYLSYRKSFIITDENLFRHYGSRFPKDVPVIQIGLGETNKTLQTVEEVLSQLLNAEADRSSYLVGIGGGIVTDVVGFIASIYMRGIRFGFVSTSLLSQVDASVGGKNGVNLQGYKNMVGVFNQPDWVICDTEMLKTLERGQFIAGFSEIIKAGAIKDIGLFNYCQENAAKALQFDKEVLDRMIYESVLMKARVVEVDEHEKGERRLLNFGHTFAHAIEKMTGILHGEAVSMGMVIAARISEKLGLSGPVTDKIKYVLELYGLPVKPNVDIQTLFQAMKQDKKREGDSIHLVLLESLGKAVTRKLTYHQLEEIIHDLRSDF